MTISGNTRYRVIFACLYWKSQGKVREFHVVRKVITLLMRICYNVDVMSDKHRARQCYSSVNILLVYFSFFSDCTAVAV